MDEFRLKISFIDVIDIVEDFNLFITVDMFNQKLLENIFGMKFKHDRAKKPGIIMRKEMYPLIKKYLTKVQ